MVLISTVTLLIAFVFHVVWWRVRLPRHTTLSLLFLFGTVLLSTVASVWFFHYPIIMAGQQLVAFVMLYSSCALVYIILYSAIEQQSPTLAIVAFMNQFGELGCDEIMLYEQLKPDQELNKRLLLIQKSGWLKTVNERSYLSPKGEYVAALFYYGAMIFGLRTGG